MLTYIIRRLLLMVPTVIGVTMVVFFIMAYAPGGFQSALDQGSQGSGVEARRLKQEMVNRYALDKPTPVQYLRWLNQVSPIGFKMSGTKPWPDATRQQLLDQLKARAWVTSDRQADTARDLVLTIAAYADLDPDTVLDKFDAAAADPGAHGPELFALIDAEPLGGPRFWDAVEQMQSTGPALAADYFYRELRTGSINKSRVLFNSIKLWDPDLGEDRNSRDVGALIYERVQITLLMNLISVPLIYLVSIVSGVLAARRRGGFFDVASGAVMLAFYSVPVILAGTLMIAYLASDKYLRWFPASGVHDLQADAMPFLPYEGGLWGTLGFALYILLWLALLIGPVIVVFAFVQAIYSCIRDRRKGQRQLNPNAILSCMVGVVMTGLGLMVLTNWLPTQMHENRGYLLDFAWHLVLPIICLTYTGFAFLTKVMRGSVLETISADFVRTARAKGVAEQQILFRHVLRNSLLPLITMAAAILPSLFVGSFVVEYIFSIQGMGLLTIDAAKNKDINIMMAVTLVGALLSLLSLLLRDILYAVADPRVSYD